MKKNNNNDNENDIHEINISVTIMYPLLVISAILITPVYLIYGVYMTLRR